jgi:hypothetical protein
MKSTARVKILLVAALGGALWSGQAAALVCDPPGAAALAATGIIMPGTAALLGAQTLAITQALQAHAGQISGDMHGQITAFGMLLEGHDSHDTQRLIQQERVRAMAAGQFSQGLCETATGATLAVAADAYGAADRALVSLGNMERRAGIGGKVPVTRAGTDYAQKRIDAGFCNGADPSCTTAGKYPDFDRAPDLTLSKSRLETADDEKIAKVLAKNLTQPIPVPALSRDQFTGPDGRELYAARSGYDAKQALADDTTTDLVVTRRRKTIDPTYYNGMAAAAGLPTASGNISQIDLDQMRFHDRFNGTFATNLKHLNDPTAVLADLGGLLGDRIAEGYRTNQLLERDNELLSAMLSVLLEGKIKQASGAAR